MIINLDITQILACYGVIVSTIAVTLSYIIMARDRGKLRLYGMIAHKYRNAGINNEGHRILQRSELCLSFTITNVGRRAILVKCLARKTKWIGKMHGYIMCDDLPKKLAEGEDLNIIFDNFEAIKDKPWSIYICDSTGKTYKMKRKHIKILYQSYDKLQ
ncbi:MAG: hypothetical protein CVT49_03345 [candidate division Zixibacteria bacterium HGW-Zixibacteria-1]|nr:MAG: hypothetical protein CVT49_03345 [candidate division Zixibacteria bacterium HGW-Zixibacteria-1]